MKDSMIRLPPPRHVDCHLWLIDLRHQINQGLDVPLPPDEQERARRFRFEIDATRYLASRTALRHVLGATLGVSPRNIAIEIGSHGKPQLRNRECHFNLSHSRDWALIAVHPNQPVGVDLECLHPINDWTALARQNYTQHENEALWTLPTEQQAVGFLRCWTRKEACLKALGSGLLIAPQGFEVGIHADAAPVEILLPQGSACRMDVSSLPISERPLSDDSPALLAAVALVTPQTADLCF